jgi:type II secretory pathway component PulF
VPGLGDSDESLPPLTADAAADAAERAAIIAAASMPLPAGLRAAAREAHSVSAAAGFRRLARALERGRSLDDCLQDGARFSPYVGGLIRAAQRSGETGVTLAALFENRRSARQYWGGILAALAYPGIVVALAIALFLLFGLYVVPIFGTMYGEFGLKLPAPTIYLLTSVDFGTRFFPWIVGAVVVIAAGTRLIGGRAAWSALVANLPFIGRAWHWTGVAEMLRGLALLVEHHVPLPEALRLTAGGVTDAYVAVQCRKLATQVEEGQPLFMALVQLRNLPLSIVPLIRCGEQTDALALALRSAAEMLEGRLKLQTHVLAQVVPPLVFAFIGVSLASAVIALFLPMMSLIQGLS